MVEVAFWINDLSKIGCFQQHWEKLCWNAAIWIPCSEKFLSFLLCAYFRELNLELVSNAIFSNVEKQYIIAEKSFSVFKGTPFSPSNTIWFFSAKCFWVFEFCHILSFVIFVVFAICYILSFWVWSNL